MRQHCIRRCCASVMAALGFLGFMAAALAIPERAQAEAPSDSTYAAANELYIAGQYEEAASKYESLVAAGIVHEDLYYNLGNAYFRMDELGRAIYNYERALRIDPDMADARHNLAVATEAVTEVVEDRLEGLESEPLWLRVITFFAVTELTCVFLAANILFFAGLIALRFLAPGFGHVMTQVLSFAAGVVFATSGVLLGAQAAYVTRVPQGIVLPHKVALREGMGERSAERAYLHAGLRVYIAERDSGWLRVRLANGAEGWVPSAAIGEL